MSKFWKKFAVIAAAGLWAGSAAAADVPINLGNTTTRSIIVRAEDTPCSNTDLPYAPDNAQCTAAGTAKSGTIVFAAACCTGLKTGTCTNANAACTAAGVPQACCTGVGIGTCPQPGAPYDFSAAAPGCSVFGTDFTDTTGQRTNAACTAASAPYACCTGLGTGTCVAGSEDFYGTLTFLNGTTWALSIPKLVWEAGVSKTLKGAGANILKNSDCTAAAAPHACCSGLGTGNCGITGNNVAFNNADGVPRPLANSDCTGAGAPGNCCTGLGTGVCSTADYWKGTSSFGQINTNCTAALTPYPCCTGNKTGTCVPQASLNLFGRGATNDQPYFGSSINPADTGMKQYCTGVGVPYSCCTGAGSGVTCPIGSQQGIALTLSCVTKKATTFYGPGNPGAAICPIVNADCTTPGFAGATPAACCTGTATGTCPLLPGQPGWTAPNALLTAFTATRIEISGLPGVNATSPAFAALDWKLVEGADTDVDGVPDEFDVDANGDDILDLGNASCTGPGAAGSVPGASGASTAAMACCTGLGTGTCTPPAPDTDGDGVLDSVDNCKYEPNAAQTDSGGINTSVPDGIGDACQCGDTNNDGRVTSTDVTVLKRALAGLSPAFSVPGLGVGLGKCNVAATATPGAAGCTATDATVISRALAGLTPGIFQGCDAAQP